MLALRDYYLEKLAAEAERFPEIGAASVNSSQNPDVWAIKFIDVTRLQPILEAFDDDASGFITISGMNRFTSSRPRDWRLVSLSKLRQTVWMTSNAPQLALLGSFLGSW